MQLILAIVQPEEADELVSTLTEHGFVTSTLASTGGFLKRGNITVLTETDDPRASDVMNIIEACCKRRPAVADQMPSPSMSRTSEWAPHLSLSPIRRATGGATIFTLAVRELHRIPDDEIYSESISHETEPPAPGAPHHMNLAVVLIESSRGASLTSALVASGFAVTRLEPREHATCRTSTLLLGIEDTRVSQAIALVHRSCRAADHRPRTAEPAAPTVIYIVEVAQCYRI